MRLRSTSGQAGVEYIAVVALVALVFAIAGAFTLQGRAIAAATVAQLRRGLCIVEGHDCADPHEPCSVSSHRKGDDLNLDVAVVRLAGGSAALVDHKSDGTIAVTVTDHLDGGISLDVGGHLKVGDRPAIGGELRAAAIASLGHGTTYEVKNDMQAEALLRLLNRPKVDPNLYTPAVRAYWRRVEAVMPHIPAPTSHYRQFEGKLSLAAEIFKADAVAGMRDDTVTGKKTYYLKAGVSLDAGELISGGVGVEGQVAVTTDRNGHPVDLMVMGSGELNASGDLPIALQSVAGHLQAGRGRSWELEGHLDLTQHGRPSVSALLKDPAGLMRLVMDDGFVQMRGYGSDKSTIGIDGKAKVGIGFGGGFKHETSSQRLLAAWTTRARASGSRATTA